MSGKTAIEWTNLTWNPVAGCTRVTAGCDHCYAFDLHDRRHEIYAKNDGCWTPNGTSMPHQYAHPFTDVQLLPARLNQPLKIRQPRMIFVNSMSDLFHSAVPEEYIRQVFAVMTEARWHTFQILTKRVGRLRQIASHFDWPANVWMGVSIERDELTPRADALRSVPAAVRFLSCEPLLGPLPTLKLEGIDWVIAGGESGSNARPLDPKWVTSLRDRCMEANVPFFFKQWGGRTAKAGGRILDNRTWDEYPHAVAR